MAATPFQPCNEAPSYFSEKCRQCRFACLAQATTPSRKEPERNSNRRLIGVLGSSAVIVGTVASLADYSSVAPALTAVGAIAVFSNLVGD